MLPIQIIWPECLEEFEAAPCSIRGKTLLGPSWRTRPDFGMCYLRKTRTEASLKIASCMVPRETRSRAGKFGVQWWRDPAPPFPSPRWENAIPRPCDTPV
jgi:hypothetical protein